MGNDNNSRSEGRAETNNMLRFKGHRAGSDSLSTVQHAENHGGSRDFLILNVPKARAKLFSLVARVFFWAAATENVPLRP